MKKKIILSICLLCTLLVFSACSKEGKGVPESVVLSDTSISIEESTKYGIKHNIDIDAHIDELQLITEYEGLYGKKTMSTPYTYQYDKSKDLWTLIEEYPSTTVYLLDEDAYIKASPWMGNGLLRSFTHNGFDFQYCITFHEINDTTISVSYSIDFESENLKDTIQSTPVTLPLLKGHRFEIDIVYSKLYIYLDVDGVDTYWKD